MSPDIPADASASFADLGVPSDLVEVLDRQRITTPFEIQAATIPDALAGRDVLGRAPTGSGKTLAFGIPLIAALPKAKSRRPTALILSPTRELAEQIRRELEPLAKARGRSLLAIYGGVGFRDQLNGLRDGADLIVACPGRLQDLIDQGAASLNEVSLVVVDEADRMADMGFLPAVRQLLDLTNANRQTVLFSATLGKEVQVLTANYQQDPVTHEVGELEPDLSLVEHRFILTEKLIKVPLAASVISDSGPTIVFCRTRHGVDRVARQLRNAGVKAGWIHGGRSQNQRDSALHSFTTGKVNALVATDVAARGIHVDGVACVIHFDPPEDDKTYVHRSGRTARAGAGGKVVSFINTDQVKDTQKLQRQLALHDEIEATPEGLEPLPQVGNKSGRQATTNGRQNSAKPSGKASGSRPGGRSAGSNRSDRPSGSTSDGQRDSRRSSQSESPVESRQATTERSNELGSTEGETYRDWTPPKKRSKRRRPTSDRAGGSKSGESKRTGKPRPKKKGARPGNAPGGSGKPSGSSSGRGRSKSPGRGR